MAVSLLVYVLALIPAQLPSEFQATTTGILIAATNPLEASRQFLEKILLGGQSLSEVWFYLVTPAIVIALFLSVLLLVAAPRLGLEGGRASMRRRTWQPATVTE